MIYPNLFVSILLFLVLFGGIQILVPVRFAFWLGLSGIVAWFVAGVELDRAGAETYKAAELLGQATILPIGGIVGGGFARAKLGPPPPRDGAYWLMLTLIGMLSYAAASFLGASAGEMIYY